MPRFNRLLITGAAGNLGRVMREGLSPLATTMRITDRGDMSPVAENEEAMPCELGDFDVEVLDVCGLRRHGDVRVGRAPDRAETVAVQRLRVRR